MSAHVMALTAGCVDERTNFKLDALVLSQLWTTVTFPVWDLAHLWTGSDVIAEPELRYSPQLPRAPWLTLTSQPGQPTDRRHPSIVGQSPLQGIKLNIVWRHDRRAQRMSWLLFKKMVPLAKKRGWRSFSVNTKISDSWCCVWCSAVKSYGLWSHLLTEVT